MNKNSLKIFLLLVLVIALGFFIQINFIHITNAGTGIGDWNTKLDNAAGKNGAGYMIDKDENDPFKIISIGIQIVLSLLGVIFLGLIIYAGMRWMQARGNEEEVSKAKDIIINSIIGLLIVLGAYVISFFVVKYLGSASLLKK